MCRAGKGRYLRIRQLTFIDITYLNSTFRKANLHGELLSEENVWIVRSTETPLQLVQLGWCESRPMSFLLGGLVIALTHPSRIPWNTNMTLRSFVSHRVRLPN